MKNTAVMTAKLQRLVALMAAMGKCTLNDFPHPP
jgi:hypothetical protein